MSDSDPDYYVSVETMQQALKGERKMTTATARPTAGKLPAAPKLTSTAPQIGAAPKKTFSIAAPVKSVERKTIVYGTGGVGKSSLMARMPGTTVFIDLDGSLPVIKDTLKDVDGNDLDLGVVTGVETWQDLRDFLHSPDCFKGVKNVVIDTLSKAEEMCLAHLLATKPHQDTGTPVNSIEGYGYGKGYQYLYEEFLNLFSDLDQLIRMGLNVGLICHDCTTEVLNPQGENYRRFEPRLQHPGSQKNSVRLKAKEWADHLLFISYDLAVNKDGKAKGGGSRTIYPVETPWAMAKSRTLRDPIPYPEGDASLWAQIFS
ncbi:MAG: AAA family ATPase [Sterolibacterium sp.]